MMLRLATWLVLALIAGAVVVLGCAAIAYRPGQPTPPFGPLPPCRSSSGPCIR